MSKTANSVMDDGPKDEDGLTATEREYLTTPLSEMEGTDRQIAFMIREKRDNARWAANALARQEEERIRREQLVA